MLKLSVVLTVLGVSCCFLGSNAELNADGLWRTFSPNALMGNATPLPLTSKDAEGEGWKRVTDCVDGLGVQYAQSKSGPSSSHPLSLYYTSAGQIAGVGVDIWGHAATSSIGPAAQPELVERGLWIPVKGDKEHWKLAVSFRDGDLMCSGNVGNDVVGDRAVINQDGIAFNLPLTQPEANKQNYRPGSCMKTMGQHYFLDFEAAPKMSWAEGNLLPVIPMYYPPDSTGKLHSIFFATPVVQHGSNLGGFGDWESPFLPGSAMCQNWCDEDCSWKKTWFWSTMHIYLNSQWKTLSCPGAEGVFGRSCPGN